MLPTKEQREHARLQGEATRIKQKADEDKAAADKATAEKLAFDARVVDRSSKLLLTLHHHVESAIKDEKKRAEIALQLDHRVDEEDRAVYERVVSVLMEPERRSTMSDYRFHFQVIDMGYMDRDITADGGPGDEYWVRRDAPCLVIEWD